jgi:hypothetical protein
MVRSRPFFNEIDANLIIIISLLVIRDNTTRWNLTYLLIRRALKLELYIKIYIRINLAELKDDELTEDDWDTFRATAEILYSFWNIIKRLEGHIKKGERGAIWEVLSAIEMLIEHFDKMKQIYT